LLRGLLLNLHVEQFVANAHEAVERDAAASNLIIRIALRGLAELRHFTGIPRRIHIGDVVAGRVQRTLRRIQPAYADQQRCAQATHSDHIWQDQV
jgi:hypothetical protein